MPTAMDVLDRARAAWQVAGCPGTVEQFVLFPAHRFRPIEAEHGRRADRQRSRRLKRKQ